MWGDILLFWFVMLSIFSYTCGPFLSSLEKYLLKSFGDFKIELFGCCFLFLFLFFFLLLCSRGSLYNIFWILIPYPLYVVHKCFPPFYRLSFTSVVSFAVQKLFILMKSHFCCLCLWCHIKKSLSRSTSRSFSLMISSRSFTISVLCLSV